MSKAALSSALFHGSILAALLLAWPTEPPPPADAGLAGSVAVLFVSGGPEAGAASATAETAPAMLELPSAAPAEHPVPAPQPAEVVEEMPPLELELAEPPPPVEDTDLAVTQMAELGMEPMPEPPPPEDALEAEKMIEKPAPQEPVAQKPKPLPATKPMPPRETETAAARQPPGPQIATPPTTATDAIRSDVGNVATSPSTGGAIPSSVGAMQTASLETGAGAGTPTGASAAPGPSAAEEADYASLLAAWLDRHKEYPDRARRKHQEGVVLCEFAIDRQGQVLRYRILQGSGFELLDEEASELMARANPVPPPPAGMDQTYVVPIVFALK